MDTFLLVLRVVLSLGVVAALLWLAQKRFAKGGRGVPEVPMRVVGRRSLGQKASVVMVDADGLRFVLGVTEQSVNVLHSGPAPEPEAEEAPVGAPADAGFARSLRAVETPAEVADGEAQAVEAQTVETQTVEMFDGAPRRMRARHQSVRHQSAGRDPLAGSILSPATWQQAGAAVRKGLNR